MSRRNFILLIIALVIIIFLGFYFFSTPSTPTGDTTSTGGFFSNLNPFGKTTPSTPTPTDNTNTIINEENPPTETEKRKLVKVSSMPVAGYASFEKEKMPKEYSTTLRYVDRATGNIYQTYTDEIQETKFSYTPIPRVYEAVFGNDANTVIMRYLKGDDRTIETFISTLPKEKVGVENTPAIDIKGSFLSANISDLSLSPDNLKVFYLITSNNTTSGIVLNLKDNKKTQVLSSPFTEWLSSWAGDKTQFINTKASGLALGYLYKIESNKLLTKVLGDITGLSTLPNRNGKLVLFNDSSLSLNFYNTNTKTTQTLGIQTQVDKCVWSRDNITVYCAVPKNISGVLYPDSWYQGETSFNDQIWMINTAERSNSFIVDPSILNEGEEIDGIKLSLDQNENNLFFVNKKDSFLWQYSLK